MLMIKANKLFSLVPGSLILPPPRTSEERPWYGWRNGAKFTSLYSFTFNAVFIIHEYIYPHSATELTFKNYVFPIHDYTYSHLRDVFIHIQRVIFIQIHDRNIHSEKDVRPQTQVLLG